MNKRGTIQERTFYSQELQEDLSLLIYLPYQYSQLYKYHLLIASDGRDYFQLGRIPRVTDELIDAQAIEPVIIVGVCYRNVDDRYEKYHPNGSQHQAYKRFLAHELVPFLDREYSTYQMGQTRALIGDSLAGTISFLTALSYPHTFGHVIMHSPFVNHDVLEAVTQFEKSELLSVYHCIGTEETAVNTTKKEILDFLTPNRELSRRLAARSFRYFYEEFKGNHTWTYWQPDIPRALKYLFK